MTNSDTNDYLNVEQNDLSAQNDYVTLKPLNIIESSEELQNSDQLALIKEQQDQLRKVYRERDEKLKKEYYKSNPLRNYAPTRGQTILPPNFIKKIETKPGEVHEFFLDNEIYHQFYNKKKQLPTVYQELRVTKDVEEDRDLYKQKLRTKLKLNLDHKEHKSTIDLIENSKKTYSEYCRYNLSKPLDVTNVESVIKQKLNKTHGATTSLEKLNDLEFNSDNDFNNISLTESFRRANVAGNSRYGPDLSIDAQTVSIKGLDDISKEIKSRKQKLAKLEQSQSSIYRVVKSGGLQKDPHHGTIYNYRQAVKAATQFYKSHDNLSEAPFQVRSKTNIEHNSSCNFNDYFTNIHSRLKLANRNLNSDLESIVDANLHPNSDIDNISNVNDINHTQLLLNGVDAGNREGGKSALLYTMPLTSEMRYQMRIKMAREKILNEQVEKTNLNKMTILQPFEDTKILINIDKVPSKILNSLLNKQHIAPRYYIPPIRAFGYFRKVVDTSKREGRASPTSSLSSSNVNKSNEQGKKGNRPRSQSRPRSQRSIKYESLKSLSEAATPYFDKRSSFVKQNTATSLKTTSVVKANDNDTSENSNDNDSLKSTLVNPMEISIK
jgi:hypothetical protein